MHTTPQVDRLYWSEASNSLTLHVFQGRKRGIFAENMQVNGVFIVDAEPILYKMPHEVTDAEKLEGGKLHLLGTVCDVQWAALRPSSFSDFQADTSLPLLSSGEMSFGPLPDDVMELLRSGNTALVVASDHEHYDFKLMPQEGISWCSN
ncbi:hypothetical protein KDL29_01780 [bacterium]|nr:hypothetical protein [bacterium]